MLAADHRRATDPARLAEVWRQALEYEPVPPTEPDTTWWRHYRERLGDEPAFDGRLFDPAGRGPAIWFQSGRPRPRPA